MKRNSLTKAWLVVLALMGSFSLLSAQNSTPKVDINLRGGIGLATPTYDLLSPVVANASMVVDGWLSNHCKLGVELSYTQMELKSKQPMLLPKEHLLNQYFIGPSIAFSSQRNSRSSWSAQGALSLGYTLLYRNQTKDGVSLMGDYDAFNKMQHGFGLNLSADIRKSIGNYYIGLGAVYSSRMIQVGAKDHHTTSFVSMAMPQIVFGITL